MGLARDSERKVSDNLGKINSRWVMDMAEVELVVVAAALVVLEVEGEEVEDAVKDGDGNSYYSHLNLWQSTPKCKCIFEFYRSSSYHS